MRVFACLCLLSILSVAELLAAPKVVITTDVESAIYQPGATATWNVRVTNDDKPAAGALTYSLRAGGLKEVDAGTATLIDGVAKITATRADAGTLLLTTSYKPADQDKPVVTTAGAAFAPEKIKASAPPPEDFDEFWKAKIAELDAVPMNIKLEQIKIDDDKVEYFKVTLDNVRGRKIYGQLAKPAGKTNLPAMLQVQWAGVYPLHKEWVVGHARNGWLALNIMPHDLPIDESAEFYQQQASKELNDYAAMGNDDRETCYFLPMFLSCRRAVDYLTQHPDWNKQSLVVHGTSQGGYQAIVTAGLHPAVTALAANVPAGCDHTGQAAGRAPGWPQWTSRTWQKKDEQKLLTTARYFDAMNFATRVRVPALVGIGLIDPACPAEGVLATCNQFQGPKEVILMPAADHSGDHRAYQQAFGPFLERQKTKSDNPLAPSK